MLITSGVLLCPPRSGERLWFFQPGVYAAFLSSYLIHTLCRRTPNARTNASIVQEPALSVTAAAALGIESALSHRL